MCHEQRIRSGTEISGISSGISETCRISKKYAKESGKRLLTGKEKAERIKVMAIGSKGRSQCRRHIEEELVMVLERGRGEC